MSEKPETPTPAPSEKSLPPGADGDNSIILDNGVYRVDIGETESGTWVWDYDGHSTLYHEYFALQSGDGSVVPSYTQDAIVQYFSETGDPGTPYSAISRYTVDGTTVLVQRTVQLAVDRPTFTMKYDLVNTGRDELSDVQFYQYADFDDGPSDFWDDQGFYEATDDLIYIRDHTGGAYAGFSGDRQSVAHHVGSYPGYSAVNEGRLNGREQYPSSTARSGDAVVALQWHLGTLQPGESTSLTLQFGAQQSVAELNEDISEPEQIPTTPPTAVSGHATTLAFVPGKREEGDGENAVHSVFPNEGITFTIDGHEFGVPVDTGFYGDEIRELPDSLAEATEESKTVAGMDGEFRHYRFKNDLSIEFEAPDGQTIDLESVRISVNAQLPENDGIHVRESDSATWRDLLPELLNPEDPERPSTTLLHEGVFDRNELFNAAREAGLFDGRALEAHTRPRYLNVERGSFRSPSGDVVEGIRAATLWGTENPYTYRLGNPELFGVELGPIRPDLGQLVPENPIIYSWLELTVLADGTRLVRVPDASVYPVHVGYLDGLKQTDSGFETIFDERVTDSGDGYNAAINEPRNNVWDHFKDEFERPTAVPYKTPHLLWNLTYEGYVNEYTNGDWNTEAGHPVMIYGTDPDDEPLPEAEIRGILPETPLDPWPTGGWGTTL